MSKATTNLTGLRINKSAGNPTPLFEPPVLTTAEINSIPLDDLRAGAIVYNITVGSLQTYTINGWENIAVAGEGSDPTFENITVNNGADITTVNATTINSTNLTVEGGDVDIDGVIISTGNVSSVNLVASDTIYGKRATGSFRFFDNAQTFVFAGGQTKLNLVTTADYLNHFTSLVAGRLTYGGGLQNGITVKVDFSFAGQFSVSGELAFDFFKNTSTPLNRSTGTTFAPDTIQSVATSFITTMNAADYIEIFISGTPGTLSFMSYNLIITQV